jgi:ubiquinone/menaquinone biosynthesis C-methylase UbiE
VKEDREERYWGRFAPSYDRDGQYVVGDAILEAINERPRREQHLGFAVEFGCGTGCFTKAIARNATKVIATDLSDAMLGVALVEPGRFDNVTIQKADCRASSLRAERDEKDAQGSDTAPVTAGVIDSPRQWPLMLWAVLVVRICMLLGERSAQMVEVKA